MGYAKLIREPIDAVFASYLVRFRVDEAKAEPAFIGRLVESQVYKSFVQSRIGGAAQPNASAPVLGSFEFLLPPRQAQRTIVDILSAYDDLIEISAPGAAGAAPPGMAATGSVTTPRMKAPAERVQSRAWTTRG